ncbi:glycosyltransferase family 39 protein [Terriglobus aquaticus]|uniref:Glycosyltransferase family 39 protein n=2 Tax=Terriglobus aquaticus TaxID=940139 RepID=A0ABW9KG39_9BACT
MWNDEFLSFYTDSLPTAQQVIHVQRYTPISLDPPTYHLLSHFSMKLLGPGPIALRMPALAGFLLLQVSLFALLRRVSTARAALFGMALPVLTASFRFAVEGRPYAWLLGLYALALFCWLSAAGRPGYTSSLARRLSLVGLFCAIALAITSHYFGLLILVPLLPAELIRTVRRRTVDWPMIATMAAGASALALVMFFKQGLVPYRQHYYINFVSLHAISRGYRDLFLQDGRASNAMQRLFALAMLAAALWIAFRLRGKRSELSKATSAMLGFGIALIALAMLPIFGYLVGRFVTHTMEVRYVVASLIPFIIALAVASGKPFRSRPVFLLAMSVTVFLATASVYSRIRNERDHAATVRARLQPSASVIARLRSNPAEHLYVQSTGELFLDAYYAPTQVPADRLAVIYDRPAEVSILGNDTDAVTAENASHFLPFATVRYQDFKAQPMPLLVNKETSGMDWIGKDLNLQHVPEYVVGDALASHIVQVDFRNVPNAAAAVR